MERRNRPIRVVVVDDHPVVRDIVRMACEAASGIEVIGEAGDGLAAVELCRHLAPDVLVLDLILPGIDGFEVARRLAPEGLCRRTLVISGRDDGETLFEVRRLGLAGFLPKTVFVEHIADAIEAVARGESVFTDEQEQAAVKVLMRMVRRIRETSRVSAALTEREVAVLRLLAESMTNRQVARRLGLSPRTVESHISTLFRKLGARNRVEAVARALGLGLVDVGPVHLDQMQ